MSNLNFSRRGVADLPLHHGKAPYWLLKRMEKLAKNIVKIILNEYGYKELFNRLSDPYWFQAFGCVLGYDWHSSGITTVVTGVLKSVIDPREYGIAICGGKGKRAKNTLNEIEYVGEILSLSSTKINELKYSSRIIAKIDNAMLQDGFNLYHHTFLFTEKGDWIVIQQGMDILNKLARRYHWSKTKNFIDAINRKIISEKLRKIVLNLSSRKSRENRRITLDLVRENPSKIYSLYKLIFKKTFSLDVFLSKNLSIKFLEKKFPSYLKMPVNINWNILKKIYEYQPKNYEEFLMIRGVGPSTIRGLALISELIYGKPADWKDPVKYSFAFGGKDGVPYPVNRRSMDNAITFLEDSIRAAEIGYNEKMKALRRLRKLLEMG